VELPIAVDGGRIVESAEGQDRQAIEVSATAPASGDATDDLRLRESHDLVFESLRTTCWAA